MPMPGLITDSSGFSPPAGCQIPDASEKAMSDLIEPEKDFLNYCIVLATKRIETSEEPEWFRKHYYGEYGELEGLKEYGLSTETLATLALALHLSYDEEQFASASEIKKRLKNARSYLEKARCKLTTLWNEPRPKGLKVESSWTALPDGGVQAESWLDPYEDIIDAIDRFLNRSAGVGDQGDGRKSLLYFFVLKLVQLVQRKGVNPPISELQTLCQLVFDGVRQQHEGGEQFSYDDMLGRMMDGEEQLGRDKRKPKKKKRVDSSRVSPSSRSHQ
jgi:hypothetical protein